MSHHLTPWRHIGRDLKRFYEQPGAAVYSTSISFVGSQQASIVYWSPSGAQLHSETIDIGGLTRAGLFRHAHNALKEQLARAGHGTLQSAWDISGQAKLRHDAMRAGHVGQDAEPAGQPDAVPESTPAAPEPVPAPVPQPPTPRGKRTPTQQTQTETQMDSNSFTQDATLQMALKGFERGGKIVASTQTLKVCRRLASKLARKYLPEEHHALLDTRFGVIVIDLLTPTILHALAERDLIPAAEWVGPASEYAFEGGVIRHGLEVTDMLGDVMADIQGELGELANLAKEFAGAAKEVVAPEASTDDEPMMIEEDFELPQDFKRMQEEAERAKVTEPAARGGNGNGSNRTM